MVLSPTNVLHCNPFANDRDTVSGLCENSLPVNRYVEVCSAQIVDELSDLGRSHEIRYSENKNVM